MRVLLTTPYDLEVPGGVNRHARGLREALVERGIEALLVGPSSAGEARDEPGVVRMGRVAVGALNGAKSRVTLDIAIGPSVRRLLRSFRPDVVHLQEPFLPTLNTWVLAYARGARRVGTFHTYSERSLGYLWAWPWCRLTNAFLDARIAVSGPALAFATRFHPAVFHLVRHGIRLPAPADCRPTGAPGLPVRVLFVGRCDEPRKGFSVLLEAMRILESLAPGRFVLEAVGPSTPRGAVSEAELKASYRAADICAVPSLGGESFGLVALEALAHGVPVVASEIEGYRDWLEGAGVGGLVPPADPEALAARLLALGTGAREFGESARRARELASGYAWSRSVDRLLTIYQGEGG